MASENILVIIQTLGGIGLFLLGMIVMTNGLTALAGDSIRKALMRFTHSPSTGAMTGAVCTALIQSSSATTVAAIGFVGAGLMTFPSALGIVFGANIGTTITGWIVVLVGFKLKLTTIVLPLIFVGTIMRLFGSRRLANIGFAIAGFGVIFVGIDVMQQGMQGLETLISFEDFQSDSFIGRLQLVGLGVLFTLITQSSSAGVAAAVTAVFSGIISFEQAAALVIGMDVGTTATALIASIGGSVEVRRTGYSHVIYNLFTATTALFLLTPYMMFWEAVSPGALVNNSEIALVAFHSMFNTLGVFIILPLTNRFVRLVERLVPESKYKFSAKLDENLLTQPSLALSNIQKNIYYEIIALLQHTQAVLSNGKKGELADIPELQRALDKTQIFIDKIHLTPDQQADWDRLIALIHTLDHLQRLHERCEEEEYRAIVARESDELKDVTSQSLNSVNKTLECLEMDHWNEAAICSNNSYVQIREQRPVLREDIVKMLATDKLNVPSATEKLEAIRWLNRVNKHISRITQHYHESIIATGK